jgi:hypothetical protein
MNLAGLGLIGLGALTMKRMMTPAKREFHYHPRGFFYKTGGRRPFRAPPGSGSGSWQYVNGHWIWYPSVSGSPAAYRR